jgi:predicted secreted Zn-dependent protease
MGGPRLALIVVLASWFIGTTALAAPKVTEKMKTYAVDATTAVRLKQQMRNRGPKGYWGYTAWFVRWSAACKVQVEVTYTMPRHINPAAMPPKLRKSFDTMVANLMTHERQHGQHGIDAAYEIDRANCIGGQAIIKKYNRIDIEFDRRTNHGGRDGVVLN